MINIKNKCKKKENIMQNKENEVKKSVVNELNALLTEYKAQNERQMQILKEAKMLIEEVKSKQNESLDILTMLVKLIWQTLGKITGNTENEDIIDLIFSKFCLGK